MYKIFLKSKFGPTGPFLPQTGPKHYILVSQELVKGFFLKLWMMMMMMMMMMKQYHQYQKVTDKNAPPSHPTLTPTKKERKKKKWFGPNEIFLSQFGPKIV